MAADSRAASEVATPLPHLPDTVRSWRERLREGAGRRASGLVLALLAEAFLALLLLTLGRSPTRVPEQPEEKVFTFAPTPEPPAPERPPAPAPRSRAASAQPRPEPRPAPPQPTPARAAPQPAEPAPVLQLSPGQLAATDIAALPRAPAPPTTRRQVAGPPDVGNPSDTPRVAGSGPHGEPLYAAAWYREPYDSELRGYLSTATGPGWAIIACRTVADFRVDSCVALDEYPDRSQIARAVLAAAWQFRVRPPIRGGQYEVGDWVRIRIDYERR